MSSARTERFVARVPIREESDVVMARRHVRVVANDAGLSEPAREALATAVSELARNILVHAGEGEILIGVARHGTRQGVVVVARDAGPGIADTARALEDGYSTAGGLGLGLPSAQRLTDEFELDSRCGQGTVVRVRRWA